MAGPIFEEILAKQVMNRVQVRQMPFNWSINPYRGCAHGCSFCYARNTHTFLGYNADDTFQKHILIKSNAKEILQQQLDKLAKRHPNRESLSEELGLVAIGTATDPYQPVEARANITRDCLEVLAEYRVPVTITTRSPLILRDLDVLAEMNVKSINISVSTLDTAVWRNLEPASPAPKKRLQTVRTLVEHGLPAGIFLAPIVPLLTDDPESLNDLISAAKEHEAQFAMASVLRLSSDVKSWFLTNLETHYPTLAPQIKTLYKESVPGKLYTESLMSRVYQLLANHQLSRYHESLQRTSPTSQALKSIRLNSLSRVRDGIQLTLPI